MINFLKKQFLFILSMIILMTAINQDIPQYLMMEDYYVSNEKIERRFDNIVEKESYESNKYIFGEDKNKNDLRDDVERVFYYVFYKDKEKNMRFSKDFTNKALSFFKNANEFSKLEKTYKRYDLSKKELNKMKNFWIKRNLLKNEFICIYEKDLKNNKYLRDNFLKVIFKMLNTEERRDHFGRYMLLKDEPFFRFLDKNKDYKFYLKNEWVKNIKRENC